MTDPDSGLSESVSRLWGRADYGYTDGYTDGYPTLETDIRAVLDALERLTEALREAEVCGNKLCVSCQRRIRTALSTTSVPEVSTIAGEEPQP